MTQTQDEIKKARRISNRLAAFQSRQRRKATIKDLEAQVAQLSAASVAQEQENKEMKGQLQAAQHQNVVLRVKLAAVKQQRALLAGSPALPFEFHAPPTLQPPTEQQQLLASGFASGFSPAALGLLNQELAQQRQALIQKLQGYQSG